jgi:hypothetical protein
MLSTGFLSSGPLSNKLRCSLGMAVCRFWLVVDVNLAFDENSAVLRAKALSLVVFIISGE